MKRAVLGVFCAIALAGCGAGKDKKIEEACQELLELTVVNPKKVQVNKSSLRAIEMEKSDAIEVLERLNDEPLTIDQAAVLDIDYQPGGQRPKSYFVSIDYTDEGGVIPRREKAFCRFYSDGQSVQLVSASLAGNVRLSGRTDILSFFAIKGKIERMSIFGEVGG